MNTTFGKTILTLSMLAATSLSQANEGFYAGVGAGQATNESCDDTGLPCDDTSSAWKGLIGYNFHKNFGLEFSYNSIGKAHAYDDSTGFNAQIDADAYALSAVGTIDITESFAMFGKVGATSWVADMRLRQDNARSDFEDDGSDITYGAGLKWTFDKEYHLSVEWQHFEIEYDNLSDMLGKEGNADVVSVLYTVSF